MYELANIQIVPEPATVAASAATFNLYLVTALKNGYYLYIQQIDDSLTMKTNALKYHAVNAAPVFLDTANNHKTMVYATD